MIPGAVETEPLAARKRFFLKKEAKTFAYWCARVAAFTCYNQKFFGSFFQKRTAFFLLARLGYSSTIKAAGISQQANSGTAAVLFCKRNQKTLI
jgi:hypothetical protein